MSGGTHLFFDLQPKPEKRRTDIWTVVDQAGYRLGAVSWWAPWRRYTFRPDSNTVYDPSCLMTIASFVAEKTEERKKARKEERVCDCKDGWVPTKKPCSSCDGTDYCPCRRPCPRCREDPVEA